MARFIKKCWSKELLIETYETKSGKMRATINGKKATKGALGLFSDPCTFAAIYWDTATYDEVLHSFIMQCKPIVD